MIFGNSVGHAFLGPHSLVRGPGSCEQPEGFAGECQAEAKLKMEDEVKIEEGPNILSFFFYEKKHGFFRVDSAAKYLCDLECPRGRCFFNVFFRGWIIVQYMRKSGCNIH